MVIVCAVVFTNSIAVITAIIGSGCLGVLVFEGRQKKMA